MGTVTGMVTPFEAAVTRKARIICFDLETYHTRDQDIAQRIRQEAMDKEPAQNVAKERKLVWHSAESRAARANEALEKTAVDVLLAEVLCCCYQSDVVNGAIDCMRESPGGSEFIPEYDGLLSLAAQWDSLAGPDTIWVGHNIEGFDLPVLLNRWRAHQIVPPQHFPVFNRGRWRGRIFDTMQRTPSGNGLGYVSLDSVCRAYGMGAAKQREWEGMPFDGSRVGEAYRANAYDLILSYCMDDVEKQAQLYYRMTCDDTWGTYIDRSDITDQIAEIRSDSTLTEGQKAMAIVRIAEAAGVIPSVA